MTAQMPDEAVRTSISKAFQTLYAHPLALSEISLQPTRKEFEGTHTFVVFPFLRISRQKPEATAKSIGDFLIKESGVVSHFNVVRGFLNLQLKESVWLDRLASVSNMKDYGKMPANGLKVMVEFSSPNTNKPLHLGHLRNNFLGDSVSRILAQAGYEVMKTNLVNDRGIHICKSMLAYRKFGKGETPQSSGMKGDHMIGHYYVKFNREYKKQVDRLIDNGMEEERALKEAPLMSEVQALLKKWENGDAEAVALWEKMNGWVYKGFEETYASMGIHFDKTYKESDTYLLGKDIVEEGLQKKIFFKKEDSSVWVDLTDEGLDEKLLLRGDGTAVYMTQDMGTCDYKYKDFPFHKSVYTVGNEQDYHFNVLFKIMKKLGRPYAQGLYHLSYGMVDLPTGKMKSREGEVVDADDLIKEMIDTAERHTAELGKIAGMPAEEAQGLYKKLALGALKYFLLKVDPKKRMLFNPEESIAFQGNTGPFIQYTHARICAILRRAESENIHPKVPDKGHLSTHERELIHLLLQYPRTVQTAAAGYSPSSVAQYAYDVAKAYNSFYQEVPIFGNGDKEQTTRRVALSETTATVIKNAMKLLGVEVPERM